MAYNEELTERVRKALAGRPGLTEKRMFGGVCYLLGGNMCCGIAKDDLIVRVGADRHAEALARPGARPMDMTGRPMSGWVLVGPAGFRTAKDLGRWIDQGATFALSLPAKNAGLYND